MIMCNRDFVYDVLYKARLEEELRVQISSISTLKDIVAPEINAELFDKMVSKLQDILCPSKSAIYSKIYNVMKLNRIRNGFLPYV